jgi:hypothetical protein
VDGAAPRRNTRAFAEFDPTSSRDRCDPTEPPTTEQVGQVGDLESATARFSRHGGDREAGRDRSGRAHSESLTDRQLVDETHREHPADLRREPTRDLLRDRERPIEVARQP